MELITDALIEGDIDIHKLHHSSTLNLLRNLCGGYDGCAKCAWSAEQQALHNLAISVFRLC